MVKSDGCTEANGHGTIAAIQPPEQAAKAVVRTDLASKHPWTAGQHQAAKDILTSQNGVTGVQGYAATSKTTTVLATLAR